MDRYDPYTDKFIRDTIDRQAAIKAIDKIESEIADGLGFEYEKWRKYFCDLPPAQPEQLSTNLAEVGTDLISRQAAIGALRNYLVGKNVPCDGTLTCRLIENEVISKLPSAQPERPKGRWIPVDSYSAFGGDEATWMAHGNPVAFYYCSECKGHAYAGENGEDILSNFCPNCGAKMER